MARSAWRRAEGDGHLQDTIESVDEVLFEVRDHHVGIIRLNRPSRRNAVNGAVARAIDALVRETEADDAIRAVILASSSPDFFCAGADLKEISEGRKDELATERGGFAGLIDAPRQKPWIAAVNGAVLAGGFELCLACDMIVASPGARFGLPEVKRGLFAAAGGVHRLVRVLPRNIAVELIATGDPIGAERAYDLGLINRLAPADGVLEEAVRLAKAIAENAPLSVRESLAIARIADESSDARLRDLSSVASDLVFASADAAEGPKAFLEKRAPVWIGR